LCALCVVLAAAAAMAPGARAGGDGFDPDDHSEDEGPAHFGFVKDERGRPVRDAKVSASFKNTLTLVTRTNATGAFRVRGFKKDIDPKDIVITCSKDGYKQERTVRRPPPKTAKKPLRSVETECRLRRV
jgi:Carboxypeptidase regulatory-like domain